MRVWGLTGSIGMGKSAVAAMLMRQGVPVFDADAEVHRLQGPGGALLSQIEARFPGTTGAQGVDRARLGAAVFAHPHERKALEAIVHPAVQRARAAFLRHNRARRVVVLDIPLLYETHADRWLAGVIVVSAPHWKQRKRVLTRPGMSPQKFARIRRLQTSDAEKCRRADIIIDTGGSFDRTRVQVRRLVACLNAKAGR
ncbi:dephospho-CoA kinase [Sphingobium algorifonticola]|uniref:Dephospho-CoA kinase n=1 Tax=Sphingobium algorifonticola TaxID=2008318 RepID=A0A437JDQ4_9SPHN|nr:dephospho-CoA kinase [Sphingobium algorifonticola]RVT44047.1 dephospho-CoA kinase [Sphingobium algorifonticola]